MSMFFRRPADVVIGPKNDIYLKRWVLLSTAWVRAYLHQFLRSDDDRALHDHPANNVSILLKGSYWEVTERGRFLRKPFRPIFRRAETAHRVELINNRPVWTLFIRGPYKREWGFHCPRGWVHWTQYVTVRDDGNEIGGGCD